MVWFVFDILQIDLNRTNCPFIYLFYFTRVFISSDNNYIWKLNSKFDKTLKLLIFGGRTIQIEKE